MGDSIRGSIFFSIFATPDGHRSARPILETPVESGLTLISKAEQLGSTPPIEENDGIDDETGPL